MRFILPIIIILVLAGCKASKDIEFEQKTVEPDPFKRAKEAAEKGGGIFNLNKRDQEGQIVNFANSNVHFPITFLICVWNIFNYPIIIKFQLNAHEKKRA